MIGIDRPMPETCDECPCGHDGACYAGGERDTAIYDHDGRQIDCPLIAIEAWKAEDEV